MACDDAPSIELDENLSGVAGMLKMLKMMWMDLVILLVRFRGL